MLKHTLVWLCFWFLVSWTLVVSCLQLLVLCPATPQHTTWGQHLERAQQNLSPSNHYAQSMQNITATVLVDKTRKDTDIDLTSLVWERTRAFWSASPGPVSYSPVPSSHPVGMPPEPKNTQKHRMFREHRVPSKAVTHIQQTTPKQ